MSDLNLDLGSRNRIRNKNTIATTLINMFGSVTFVDHHYFFKTVYLMFKTFRIGLRLLDVNNNSLLDVHSAMNPVMVNVRHRPY